jgi:hypothetical protein
MTCFVLAFRSRILFSARFYKSSAVCDVCRIRHRAARFIRVVAFLGRALLVMIARQILSALKRVSGLHARVPSVAFRLPPPCDLKGRKCGSFCPSNRKVAKSTNSELIHNNAIMQQVFIPLLNCYYSLGIDNRTLGGSRPGVLIQ